MTGSHPEPSERGTGTLNALWPSAKLFPLPFRNFKIIYRRYAGLYFCICVDVNDNNLAYLEAIHNFVEVLNEYFHNVCELDLVFNFYKVYTVVDEMFLAGEIRETSQTKVLKQLLMLQSLE
ncbi:AP-2 complex subunit sigma [Echinops telfairi]|uniref:AP-2 complex subunit sigma n=1 Tax=Echinops telfairi TaxID=9371 RepID=A0AC55DAK2_ECHTE|nr:AP-2 complex subunit sigma [Echinops telfairi]